MDASSSRLDASGGGHKNRDNHPIHQIREEAIHFLYGKAHMESVTGCHASRACRINSKGDTGTREVTDMLAAARALEEALAVNSRHLPSLEALAFLHDTQARPSGTRSEKSSLW